MSGLFSSPQSQAQQAAATTNQYNQQTIAQAEKYANTASTNEQNAIAQASPNSYFTAASQMSPQAYQMNPNDTQTFGVTSPPGTFQGSPFSVNAGQPSQYQNPFAQQVPAINPLTGKAIQPVAVQGKAQ